MEYRYRTRGVCSREIFIDMDGDIIREVKFVGGCNGNTQGISALVKGRTKQEVISLLRGIDCGMRGTSCPDQLANALEAIEE